MIYAALSHISNQLNQFLKRSFDLNEDVVVLSNISEQDGTLAPNINNKLVVFLVNVERDTSTSRYQGGGRGIDVSASGYPPVFLNLYVMVAGNFSGGNYSEALKFLSNAVSFFQRQPVFDHQTTPDMDRRIDKLVLEIENLNMQDLSSMWGMLSGKYLPSVLYKVRMVSFEAGDILSQLSPIKGFLASLD